jgi:hypothetical protein
MRSAVRRHHLYYVKVNKSGRSLRVYRDVLVDPKKYYE